MKAYSFKNTFLNYPRGLEPSLKRPESGHQILFTKLFCLLACLWQIILWTKLGFRPIQRFRLDLIVLFPLTKMFLFRTIANLYKNYSCSLFLPFCLALSFLSSGKWEAADSQLDPSSPAVVRWDAFEGNFLRRMMNEIRISITSEDKTKENIVMMTIWLERTEDDG